MKLFPYAFRELLNNKRFVLLFIINLSLGLTGFVALNSFKLSLDSTIKGRSKTVLGADFGISARRPLTQKEMQLVDSQVGENFQSSYMIEMFSMVANQNKRSRLVQLKAIESNFPFYGDILLENRGVVEGSAHKALSEDNKVWIYPELLRQFDIQKGDALYIGEATFVVDDVVKEDAAAGLSTSMAPRIYISRQNLQKTGLLREGSIAWHSLVYKLPGQPLDTLNSYREKVFESLQSPEIRVYTHENVSAMMMTLMTRLNDFLGLASLVALFLSAVSSGFLFRSYFRKQMKSMAILMSLGLSRTQALIYSISQVSILGFVSSLFAFFLSIGVIQALDILTRELLPFQVQYGFDLSAMGFCFLVGTLGSVLLSLPILIATRHIRPIFLINGFQSHSQSPFWERALASLPGIALFTWMSIDLSNSYQIGGLFTGLFFASSLILAGLALLFFKSAEKFTPKISLGLSWALRDLARKPASTLTGFVAIGLGSLLLNLIPQIQTTLQSELDRPEQSKLPSLFMFDIQEEQLPSFQSILKEQNVEVDQISPMIRARLLTVNEKEFDKGEGMNEELTREQESEMRFRNRGFNLSYRSEFSESESLEEGVPFSGTYDESSGELPQISVEERFAGRLGLKVGDILKFDIESIPIVGKIVNLRKVQWTSFRPNFFVQFQPGVLEMAPKTFVATAPFLSLERKYQLQDRLVEALPNISLVDVSRIVKRISEIMLQMSWALFAMSLLCLIAGFVVIYSIATHQASERGWEIGLLKALGAPFPSIRAQFFWQFGLVGFLALSFGAVLSLVISFLISSYLFESHWVFHYTTPLLSVVIGTLLSLGVTVFATSKALSAKTKDLFSAQ